MSPAPLVLVLDDNADTVQMVSMALREAGYDVITASNGIDGLAMAREWQPQLVITDLLMPGMSGFRVIERLRCDSAFQPKVLLISAIDEPTQRAYAHALGAEGFLAKPFTLHDLIDSVRQLLPLEADAVEAVEVTIAGPA